MQVASAEISSSSPPQQAPAARNHQAPAIYPLLNCMVLSWLPLYEYQNKLSVALPLLPLQIIDTESLPESLAGLIPWLGAYRNPSPVQVAHINSLPAEIIKEILDHCSLKDLLHLTSANKAAWAVRYHIPRLQHLHFKTPSDVEEFLSACWETQQTASLSGAVRIREHFREVKVLSLALSEQLTSKQYERLCMCLPGVTELRIALAFEQSCVSLAPLLKAAKKYLTLTDLRITSYSLDEFEFEQDVLPNELWELTTLQRLALERLNITEISEKISQLQALKLLTLWRIKIKSLPASLGLLSSLETLSLSELPISEIPEEIGNLQASLKTFNLAFMDIKTLPTSLGQLEKLETLVMTGLNEIKEFPAEIGRLTALKTLRLRGMSNLQALPAGSLGQLLKLEELELSFQFEKYVKEEIPDISQLIALKSLLLSITSVKILPSLKQLQKHDKLYLCTPNIVELPSTIELLPALKSLNLDCMRSLKTLPAGLGYLPALEKITISGSNLNLVIPQTCMSFIKKIVGI